MEDLVSVIIPVYNVEKYLDKCVESIVNQIYQNLEILLINDGSKDNSGKLCDAWHEKDKRIKVIHKENGGLSDARNVGIRNAKGKYLLFVDSDDYLELDMIDNLYKNALKNDAQIVAGGFIYETNLEQTPYYAEKNYVANSEEILKRLFTNNDISPAICDKLYLKSLFDEIEFPVGKIHEDTATLYRLFDKAEVICHINKAGYHYVQREQSIIHKQFNKKNLVILEFKEEMVQFIKGKYTSLLNEAENFYIEDLNKYILLCYKNNLKEEYQFWKHKLKQYLVRIFRNSKMKWKTKIKSILIMGGFSRFLMK